MKTTMIGLLLFSCIGAASAQTAPAKPVPPVKAEQQTASFDDFVNKNALKIVSLAPGKEAPVINGEVARKNKLLLSEYNITVLENEGQYFKIQGENNYIQVASMYRLRVMFDSQQNIKP